MLLLNYIKRYFDPLSGDLIPLLSLVVLRRKQDTDKALVVSDLRVVDGDNKGLIGE